MIVPSEFCGAFVTPGTCRTAGVGVQWDFCASEPIKKLGNARFCMDTYFSWLGYENASHGDKITPAPDITAVEKRSRAADSPNQRPVKIMKSIPAAKTY